MSLAHASFMGVMSFFKRASEKALTSPLARMFPTTCKAALGVDVPMPMMFDDVEDSMDTREFHVFEEFKLSKDSRPLDVSMRQDAPLTSCNVNLNDSVPVPSVKYDGAIANMVFPKAHAFTTFDSLEKRPVVKAVENEYVGVTVLPAGPMNCVVAVTEVEVRGIVVLYA